MLYNSVLGVTCKKLPKGCTIIGKKIVYDADLTIPSKDDIIIKLSGETSRDRVKEVGRSERKAKTFYRAEGFNEVERISKKFEKRA